MQTSSRSFDVDPHLKSSGMYMDHKFKWAVNYSTSPINHYFFNMVLYKISIWCSCRPSITTTHLCAVTGICHVLVDSWLKA